MTNISDLDKLYKDSCASELMRQAFTSMWMLFNHSFMFALIGASYYVSYKAIMKLRSQNIFPDSTRILLFTAVINGIIHQGTMAVIRSTALYNALIYKYEPCSLLFRSSDCFIQIIIYYHTNLFSSLCCISLFVDRVLSRNPRSFYNLNQEVISVFYIFLQLLIPLALLYWVFGDSVYTGYVPMCNYPPANASEKFYLVSYIRLGFLGFIFIASLIMHFNNKKREKRMVHNVYDTESRYKSYESYLATKAVCIIILSQVVCLFATSAVPMIFKRFQNEMPPIVYHLVIAYQAGLTYANFLVPIIIWYQTDRISERRRMMINKLKEQTESAEDHFASLQIYWR